AVPNIRRDIAVVNSRDADAIGLIDIKLGIVSASNGSGAGLDDGPPGVIGAARIKHVEHQGILIDVGATAVGARAVAHDVAAPGIETGIEAGVAAVATGGGELHYAGGHAIDVGDAETRRRAEAGVGLDCN